MPSQHEHDEKFGHQLVLEKLFNKNQLIPRLREEFDLPIFKKYFVELGIPVDFGINLMVQIALHKRADVSTMVGVLRKYVDDAQQAANYLMTAALNGILYWEPITRVFIVRFAIPADVQLELDKFQFPLPMVVPPQEVIENTDIGMYLSKGFISLKAMYHHDEDLCLDHINSLNNMKLCINFDTVRMVKNKWRNLDKQKPSETRNDFMKRKKAFEKYDRVTKEVLSLVLMEENSFYLTHQPDKRGRTYCKGYHINYQGTAWNKAVVEFYDKESIE